MGPPQSLVLVRHGRSDYNLAGRLNGDPRVPVHLDAVGIGQARALRPLIDALPVDLAVHTRFGRTRETLDILLEDRDLPRRECPELDDVLLGEFEGAGIEEYRAWRAEHGDADTPRGGESRIDVLRRYTGAFERLSRAAARMPLVVTHDIPIRFLANAARGEHPLRGSVTAVANASVLTVSGPELREAVRVMKAALPGAAS